jgi:hypothetical protein
MSDFTVNDRRLFDKDGNMNKGSDSQEPQGESQAKAPLEERTAGKSPEPQDKAESLDMGGMPADIGSLFLYLTTSAFFQMGEKTPDGQPLPDTPNLPAAKHLIDLLGILEQKTRGNLEPQEEALLKALLYDVRLKYVSLTSGKKN